MFSAFNPSKCTHTWSSGQPTMRRLGSSRGFGGLLKVLTSVVDNSCRSRDSNPQPQITSLTLYPLGHNCPASSLHFTHPKCIYIYGAMGTHVTAPGEQLGVRCLAQGYLSRGIEGGESAGCHFPKPTIPAGPRLEPANFVLRVRLSNHKATSSPKVKHLNLHCGAVL